MRNKNNVVTAARPLAAPTTRGRHGALFTIDACDDAVLQRAIQWGMSGRLEHSAVEFVEALFDACAADREGVTDMRTLEAVTGKARATILLRCKMLIERGLMEKTLLPRKKRRSVTFYRLRQDGWRTADTDHDADTQQEIALPEIDYPPDTLLYDARHNVPAKGEAFSIFSLFSALPTGKSGRFTERPYETQVHIGPDRFHLAVRPTAGTKVATVYDLRTLAAIVTLVNDRINAGAPCANPFVFRFEEILDVLQCEKTGGVKRSVRASIQRWESTGFKIVAATKALCDRYQGLIELEDTFRLVTRTKILSYVGAKGKTPGQIAIYLEEGLLHRIAHPEMKYLVALHPESFKERNPFAYKLYLWCRRAIRHQHQPREWGGAWLHRELEPLRAAREFRRSMEQQFERFYDPHIQAARMYGYCFTIHRDRWTYRLWADEKDRLVGTSSYYAYSERVGEGARLEAPIG